MSARLEDRAWTVERCINEVKPFAKSSYAPPVFIGPNDNKNMPLKTKREPVFLSASQMRIAGLKHSKGGVKLASSARLQITSSILFADLP